jgi:hypothetical protein
VCFCVSVHHYSDLCAVGDAMLEGEILYRQGDVKAAFAKLEQVSDGEKRVGKRLEGVIVCW